MKVEVDCYSGYKEDEHPIRFRLDNREYEVTEVLDQWYGPRDVCFKVRAHDGNLYVLRRESLTSGGTWSLEAFRETRGRAEGDA